MSGYIIHRCEHCTLRSGSKKIGELPPRWSRRSGLVLCERCTNLYKENERRRKRGEPPLSL